MHIPTRYKNENPEEIRSFLRANSFGVLVSSKNDEILATHIPLIFETKQDGKEILHAHISKVNDQVAHLEDGTEVLCIFNGPHSYISSSWYDFEEVPTWNYIAVHVRGALRILDKEGLRNSVKSLMDKYETGQEKPVRMEGLSEKTLKQMEGIVGFEIEITSIEAAYKLSQNMNDKNHKGIVSRLRENNNPTEKAIADAMEKSRE